MKNKIIPKKTILILITVLFLFPFSNIFGYFPNECGDLDNSGVLDIADLVYLVEYMFLQGPEPEYLWKIDYDHSQEIDIDDMVMMVDCFFWEQEPIYCLMFHDETPGTCLHDKSMDKAAGSQFSCSDTLAGNGTEEMYAEWYGDQIKITHTNAYEQCCLEYMVDYNIQYPGQQIIIDAYEKDTAASPCFCMCYFNLESYSPWINYHFMEEIDCIVTLYGIDEEIVGVDTVTIGGNGSLVTEVIGNDLTIWHMNAFYNCCPNFYTEYVYDDNNITVTWHDTLGMCDCICRFNLQSTLYDLPEGEYIITLINDGYPVGGDTVGVDTVVIGEFVPKVIGFDNGPCEMETTDPIEDIGYIYSNNTLTMVHNNSEFNCSFILHPYFMQVGDTLRFYEINAATEYVYCFCFYDISITAKRVLPGTYVVEVYKRNYFWEPLVLADRRTITF